MFSNKVGVFNQLLQNHYYGSDCLFIMLLEVCLIMNFRLFSTKPYGQFPPVSLIILYLTMLTDIFLLRSFYICSSCSFYSSFCPNPNSSFCQTSQNSSKIKLESFNINDKHVTLK